jgi:putative transposase
MPDYRRFRMPGGTYFFTVNLLERRSDFLVQHIDSLRDAVRATRRQRPFHIDGWVVLPDHMHCLWTLPPGDADFSNRWKAIKIRFVRTIEPTERRSAVRSS